MKRFLSLLLALILVLGSFPAYALAPVGLTATVDPLITQAYEQGDEAIPILVYMRNTVDINQVALQSVGDTYDVVVDTLKSTTFRTQQPLLQELKSDIQKGEVSDVRSLYVANVITMTATPEVIARIAARSDVEEILFDRIIPHEMPEIVPSAKEIRPTPEGVEWNVAKIGADLAWEQGVTGKGITVGIIDSGVDGNHPALARKWKGFGQTDSSKYWFDGVAGKPFPYDDPSSPHGTHVTGTILGSEADGTNKIGVAPEAQWIAAKAFSPLGGSLSAILNSAQFMMDQRPDVVNNSWGQDPGKDSFFERAVNNWRAAGIVPVFAAGNVTPRVPQIDGSINCPANYLNVVAVGATDIDDNLGDFSLLGPTPYDPTRIKPDVSAPGVNIRSSVTGGGYQDGWNGTSMATPAVTGVVALMKQVDGSQPVEYYEDLLRETASPRTDERFRQSPNMGYGYGIVNAFAAVNHMLEGNVGTIKGTVSAATDVESNPMISHTQTQTVAFLSHDLELLVQASDPVSVASVKAIVTDPNGTTEYPMSDISGDEKSGQFRIVLPANKLVEGKLTYSFEAESFQGKKATTKEYTLDVLFGYKPGEYDEDFESEPTGWTLQGDWEWGELTKEPFEAHSGDKVIATRLNGPYTDFANSRLVSPPLDLRNTEKAYLSFYHWYDTPIVQDIDRGSILISTNGGLSFYPIDKEYSGNGKNWAQVGVNLSEYGLNEKPVLVAFDFSSDIYDNGSGWIIDDVKLNVSGSSVPSTITGLKEVENNLNYVSLAWDHVSDGDFDYYEIIRTSPEDTWGETYTTWEPKLTDYAIEGQTTYTYSVVAVNFAGDKSAEPATIDITTSDVVPYFQDNFDSSWMTKFESGGINNTWEYGEPNEWDPSNSSGPAKPASSPYVWGTNLNGEYGKRSKSYIQNTETFNIPLEGNAFLEFNHWYEFEQINPLEYAVVEISVDQGETWHEISKRYSGPKKTWDLESLSLNDYRGKNNVLIRFTMHSDEVFQYPGWFISKVMAYSLPEEATGASVTEEVVEKELAEPQEISLTTQSIGLFEDTAIEAAEVLSQPIEARLSVVETGRYTHSSIRTGQYELLHKASETLTLRAQAYGYEDQDQQFQLDPAEVQEVNFFLSPKQELPVTGQLVDATDKTPVVGAKLRLREDAKIAEVYTDESGSFTFPSVYVGDYTLVATHSDYVETELAIIVSPEQTEDHYLELKRFVGFDDSLKYDDGSAENAILFGPGSGSLVQFETNEFIKVTGMEVFFWSADWPVPGGNETSIAIVRMDETGKPLGIVGEPRVVNVVRGAWNTFDLTDYNFGTDKTFGLAVIQTKDNTRSPGMALDTGGQGFVPSGKSFRYSGGVLTPLDRMGVIGNFMIRAQIERSLEDIQIINLDTTHYTNTREVEVIGRVKSDSTVNLYLNGTKAKTVDTKDLVFTTTIEIKSDETRLQATAEKDGKETQPTDPITIIYDDVLPELTIAKPADGSRQDERYLLTEGRVFDANFEQLTINGQMVEVNQTGSFSHELILELGQNTIEYRAVDKAGNVQVVTRTVIVGEPAQNLEFTLVNPAQDVILLQGEKLDILATGAAGQAYYQLALGTTPSSDWLPMEQTEAGYEATWQAPEQVLGEFYLHLKLVNDDGETVLFAPRTVRVVQDLIHDRLAGNNRYETAYRIAQEIGQSDKVYLVNGLSYADAAVAGPLAEKDKAPILLSGPDRLPAQMLDELKDIGAKEVVLIGGEGVLSPAIVKELEAQGLKTSRLAGKNRYETALAIAEAYGPAEEYFLASGLSLVDAISVGGYGRPVLLTGNQLTDGVKATLQTADKVYIVGGEGVVSKDIAQALGEKAIRLAGKNRFATNLAILDQFAPQSARMVVANGISVVDALSAAVLSRPILLVDVNRLPAGAAEYLEQSKARDILFLGGYGAISQDVEDQILNILQP